MAQFDMRGQKVSGNQYVAGRDMNFGAVQSQADLIGELEKLKGEFAKAADEGVLSEDAATDAQYQVTKAVQQAKKPDADKKTIVDHLETVKAIIGNVTAASGLVLSVANAIMAVQKLF
jgi:division protein CdvB (Snf7/Vps24/ESCRT-III family)